jgi:hypothetical protein
VIPLPGASMRRSHLGGALRGLAVLGLCAAAACGGDDGGPAPNPDDGYDTADTAPPDGGGAGADPEAPSDDGSTGGGDTGGGGDDGTADGGAHGDRGWVPGEPIWFRSLGGRGEERVESIAAHPAGGVVAVTEIGVPPHHGLVWLDEGGRVIRSMEPLDVEGLEHVEITVGPGGEIFVAARSFNPDAGLVMKLSPNGERVWSRRVVPLWPLSIAADGLGNVVFAARDGNDYRLYKVDPSGATLWSLRGGSNEHASSGVFAVAADGSVVLSECAWDSPSTLRKLDPAGNLEWQFEYGPREQHGEPDVCIEGMGTARDGSILAIGYNFEHFTFAGTTISPGYVAARFLLGIGPSGEPHFARSLPAPVDDSDGLQLVVAPSGWLALLVIGNPACDSVMKLNARGEVQFGAGIGNCMFAHASDIAIGRDEAVLVSGWFDGENDFGFGPVSPTGWHGSWGPADGFVMAIAP